MTVFVEINYAEFYGSHMCVRVFDVKTSRGEIGENV